MEDIVGNMAYFTPAEQELLGVRGPQPIDAFDATTHYERVRDRRAFVISKRDEIESDYAQLMERDAELLQLDWDEATLMNIEYDLAPIKAMLSDAVFDRMMADTEPNK